MYQRRGAYYFVDKAGRWLPLGRDYPLAMAEYGRLSGPGATCKTMQNVIDRYRVHVLPQKAESTQKDQHSELTRLGSVFGLMRPDEITTQHVYQYLDERSATPTAARHEVSLLHHLFKKAIRWGAGTRNPVSGVELPKTSPRDRYIGDQEFESVYELGGATVRVAMDFALLTGLRLGDILRLNRDSLLEDGMFVPTSKTGKGLLFEYTDELHRAIKRSRALKPQVPGYYLVRSRTGDRYTVNGFQSNWQRVMKKAVEGGVEHFTFNDIRAKSASDSSTLAEASERLGHSNTAITKSVYWRKATTVKPLK